MGLGQPFSKMVAEVGHIRAVIAVNTSVNFMMKCEMRVRLEWNTYLLNRA